MFVGRTRSYIFAIQTFPKQKQSTFKNITHDQFLTENFNRLIVQHFSKHYKVKLDLDGLRKARYPRITKRATERVSVLFLWCDQRQETFVNIGLFQATTN